MSERVGQAEDAVVTISFTIHGKVQGVFFRKHTQKQAVELGLRGWVMNTAEGTVKGEAQGAPENVQRMATWLSTVGSPKSKIKKAAIQHVERPADHYAAFDVRK